MSNSDVPARVGADEQGVNPSDEMPTDFISQMIDIADSYPRDERQQSAAQIVEAYEHGWCSRNGAGCP